MYIKTPPKHHIRGAKMSKRQWFHSKTLREVSQRQWCKDVKYSSLGLVKPVLLSLSENYKLTPSKRLCICTCESILNKAPNNARDSIINCPEVFLKKTFVMNSDGWVRKLLPMSPCKCFHFPESPLVSSQKVKSRVSPFDWNLPILEELKVGTDTN